MEERIRAQLRITRSLIDTYIIEWGKSKSKMSERFNYNALSGYFYAEECLIIALGEAT